MLIDYPLLGKAMSFYSAIGYKPIEVPWMVKPDVSGVTCGDRKRIITTQRHHSKGQEGADLIGSGEQGLIQLYADGDLPEGSYVCCTPCFREESNFDEYHQSTFMKVELATVMAASKLRETVFPHPPEASRWHSHHNIASFVDWYVYRCVNHALGFFMSHTDKKVSVVATDDGYDIEIDSVEVGSYGFRPIFRRDLQQDTAKYAYDALWIYGTGLALPRFTQLAGNKSFDDDAYSLLPAHP